MTNLLANGGFEASSGVGGGSVAGPGWTTAYAACGPNLFSAPCGAATWAYFDTNAGQVTGNHPAAVPIPALGAHSMAVNVGPNTAIPIIEWANVPLVNGSLYRISMDAAVIIFPFSVALRIDGNVILPVPAPPVASEWFTVSDTFVWTGATGNYTVALHSNSGVAGGNDHTFDNFILERELELPVPGCCTGALVCYQDVTPCEVGPAQTTLGDLHRFDSGLVVVDAPHVLRTGTGICSGAIIDGVQAAEAIIDGNYAGNFATSKFIIQPGVAAGTGFPGSNITLEFDVPRSGIDNFRIFHGYGGILNDCDGVGPGGLIEVYNSANVLIAGPIAMVSGNSGAGWVTPLGGPLSDVKRIEVSPIVHAACSGANICTGIREIELVGGWNSLLTWQCGGRVFTALVLGEADGITVAGGSLTQVGGPHTMTFSVNNGTDFVGTITTDTPGMFSTLVFDQDNPEVTVSGGGTATFAVSFAFANPVRRAIANLSESPAVVRDANTNEVLTDGQFEIVPCGERGIE